MYEEIRLRKRKEEQKLEEAVHEQNQFQTSVRGLKVRGTYSSKNEADVRARVLHTAYT